MVDLPAVGNDNVVITVTLFFVTLTHDVLYVVQ